MHRGAAADDDDSITQRIGRRITDQNSFAFVADMRGRQMWYRVRLITGKNAGTTPYRGPKVEALNQHFANISADSSYQSPFPKATVNQAKQEFSEYFIFNLLDKPKPTATGLDGLPVWFICLAAPWIAGPVSRIFICLTAHQLSQCSGNVVALLLFLKLLNQ